MNFILIGYKSCGKTTLANAFASTYPYACIDTDDVLLANTGADSIRVLHQQLGEKAFRDSESDVIASMTLDGPTVIATGGGVILRPNNIDTLKKLGHIVYLQSSQETVKQRMLSSVALPSFINPNRIDEDFAEYFEQRQQRYLDAADSIIDTENKAVLQLVEELEQRR